MSKKIETNCVVCQRPFLENSETYYWHLRTHQAEKDLQVKPPEATRPIIGGNRDLPPIFKGMPPNFAEIIKNVGGQIVPREKGDLHLTIDIVLDKNLNPKATSVTSHYEE